MAVGASSGERVPAFKERYYADTISTDMHVASMNAGMKDMLNVMSKFLALGMPLDQVIAKSTWAPAKAIKQEALGHLSVGAVADVAVLRLEKGRFGFLDQDGARMSGTQKLTAEVTIKDGKIVYDLNGLASPEWSARPASASGWPVDAARYVFYARRRRARAEGAPRATAMGSPAGRSPPVKLGGFEMLRRLLFALVVCMGGAADAEAQLAEQTGLVGTVTDSGGGVIAGASVTAVNVETQDTYETVSNEQGQYTIPNVRIGRYSLTIALQGFKTFQVTGLQVAGNQVVRRDAVLDVGERTETVVVEGKAVVLATDRAALSQTIDTRAVSELPNLGRNVWSLASTTPGVLAGNTSDIGFSFRGAGQRSIQNNMTLDGISSSSNLLAMTSMRPIQDAVEEVQVQTGSTSAEYRLLPRRPRERRHQERHERLPRLRLRVFPERSAQRPRLFR